MLISEHLPDSLGSIPEPVLRMEGMDLYALTFPAQCMFVVWKGYLSLYSGIAQEAAKATLVYAQEHNVKVMISNHDLLLGNTADFRKWVDEKYWPAAINVGLNTEIILPCPDFMGTTTMNLLYEQSNLKELITKGCFSVLEAKDAEDAVDMAKRIVTCDQFQD